MTVKTSNTNKYQYFDNVKNRNYVNFELLKTLPLYLIRNFENKIPDAAFEKVVIDKRSMEVIKKLESEQRAATLYYYDQEEKLFHMRVAVGIDPNTPRAEKKKLIEKFGITRVVAPTSLNHPGVVHQALRRSIERVEQDEVILQVMEKWDASSLLLGGSCYREGNHFVFINRSGRNENLFRPNELGGACFSFPMDTFLEDAVNVKIVKKLTINEISNVVTNKNIVIVMNNGHYSVYYSNRNSNKLEKLTYKNDCLSLIESLLGKFVYSNRLDQSVELYSVVPKVARGVEFLALEAQLSHFGYRLTVALRKQGYDGPPVSSMPEYYTPAFIAGARNLPERYFRVLSRASLEYLNKNLSCVQDTNEEDNSEKSSFSNYKLDELGTRENCYGFKNEWLWEQRIREHTHLIHALLARNLLITANQNLEFPERARGAYTNQFSLLLSQVEDSGMDLYSYRFLQRRENSIVLATEYSIKIDNRWINSEKEYYGDHSIFITTTDSKEEIMVELTGSCFGNKSAIIHGSESKVVSEFIKRKRETKALEDLQLPFDFFDFLSEKFSLENKNNLLFPVDDFPLWLSAYVSASRTNNIGFMQTLGNKLLSDKISSDKINLIFSKGIEYANSTNNQVLLDNLFSIRQALENNEKECPIISRSVNQLVGIELDGSILTDVPLSLEGAKLSSDQIKKICSDNQRIDFSGADLSNLTIENLNLDNSCFQRAKLEGTRFINVDLKGADFSDTDLRTVEFLGEKELLIANLKGAKLTAKQLEALYKRGVRDFFGVDLRSVHLEKLDLSGVSLKGALLSGATLNQVNLTDVDLSEVDLTKVRIEGVTLPISNLEGTKLSKEQLTAFYQQGQRDFSYCDLSGLDLSDINLSGASLKGANLIGTQFENAQLDKADFSSSLLNRTVFDSSSLREAVFGSEQEQFEDCVSFKKADLSYVDFSNQDLRTVDLEGAILARAKLQNSNLSGLSLSGANLTGANLSCADLSQVNLTGANLSYANLSEANLRKADLTRATLTKAQLGHNDMTDSTVIDVDFSSIEVAHAMIHEKKKQENSNEENKRVGRNLPRVHLILDGVLLNGRQYSHLKRVGQENFLKSITISSEDNECFVRQKKEKQQPMFFQFKENEQTLYEAKEFITMTVLNDFVKKLQKISPRMGGQFELFKLLRKPSDSQSDARERCFKLVESQCEEIEIEQVDDFREAIQAYEGLDEFDELLFGEGGLLLQFRDSPIQDAHFLQAVAGFDFEAFREKHYGSINSKHNI